MLESVRTFLDAAVDLVAVGLAGPLLGRVGEAAALTVDLLELDEQRTEGAIGASRPLGGRDGRGRWGREHDGDFAVRCDGTAVGLSRLEADAAGAVFGLCTYGLGHARLAPCA